MAKYILVYDTTEEEIEKIAEANDLPTSEIIDMLMDYVEEMKKDNGLI